MQTNTYNVAKDELNAFYVFISFMLLSVLLHVMNTVHFHRSVNTKSTRSSTP